MIQSPFISTRKFCLVLLFALCIGWLNCAGATQTAAEKEAELKEVRARIEAVKQRLGASEGQRDELVGQLKDADLNVQSKRRDLTAIRAERQALERQVAQLSRERAQTEKDIASERQQLSDELRIAYLNGHAENLKLVLNQEDPVELGRMLTYYGYFGRARAEHIAVIRDRLAHLALLVEKITAESERRKQIEASVAQSVDALADARQQRRKELAALQASLRSHGSELKRLEQQAAGLSRLITELRRALEQFPALPPGAFTKVQGKLPWPVNGKLMAKFGTPRAGGLLKWDGILIGAAAGAQVRTPFHGRVVYADWRSGFNLLVVIDHGGGYLSVYGNLEELYHKAGDTVGPGDALGALAEQGTENQGALYMEIRKGAQPLDPLRWLTRP
jgi:murein hydrolase activator